MLKKFVREEKRTQTCCRCWITLVIILVTLEFDFKVNLFGQQANDENNNSANHVYIIIQNEI